MVDNRFRLLMAGFLALVAAGVGFGVRAGLLKVWSEQYGFTFTELGTITGGGLLGFGLVILVAGFLIDAFGYRPLMLAAVVCHVVSAIMLFCATPVFEALGKDATYWVLYLSAIIFAVGNGICEAVINPLTAKIYPEQKTHYLNILHAGWPAGLVLGGLIALLAGRAPWELLLATYLVPAAVYGYISLVEKFPQTDVELGTNSLGRMLADCLGPLFLFLLVIHTMVGYVELGTDSWINKITGSILESPARGTMLFIYASSVMFVLRFFAGPIVHRISSVGLLLASACIGATGLYLISGASGLAMMIAAVTIYSVGKTFLWPTMLGVVGEQFPRSATVAMALLGFAGMTSAGLLGGPGIGYKQDRFAASKLAELSPETYERFRADEPRGFLFFEPVRGLDGRRVGVIEDGGEKLAIDKQLAQESGEWESEKFAQLRELDAWWQQEKAHMSTDKPAVAAAGLHGSRMAVRLTALVPATMAVCYVVLLVWLRQRPAGGGHQTQPHTA
jgi:MFS family permease